MDPYAKAHVRELKWCDELFGHTIGHADADLSFDERDSAPFVPKCVVETRTERSPACTISGRAGA